MNGTLCKTESPVDDLFPCTAATSTPLDFFATAPMQAVWREPDWQHEEEAFTSFEAAISNRVLALKELRISTYLETAPRCGISPALARLSNRACTLWHSIRASRNWKRGVLLLGTALMFTLIGFDLMGLPVLHA